MLPGLFEDAGEAESIAGRLPGLLRSEAVEPLVGDGGTYRPLIVDDGQLYRHRDWVEEGRLADAVAGRIQPTWYGDSWPEDAQWSRREIDGALEEVVEAFEPVPTPEQQYAVATAATSPLSVITGGPGTGKTSLVVTLLRVVVSLGVEPDRIALAAPTGKAADRLGEAVDAQLAAEAAPSAARGDGQLTLVGVDGARREGPEERDRWIAADLEEPATILRLLGY
jgi:exodeoxyribonuclease V alpha subunit